MRVCEIAKSCATSQSPHWMCGKERSEPRPAAPSATGSVSASAAAPDAGPAAHHPLQQLTAAHRAAIGQPQPRRALRGAARVPTLGTPEVAPGHSAQSSPGQWSPRDCADAGWVKHAPVHALLRLRPPAPNARSLVSARTSPSVIPGHWFHSTRNANAELLNTRRSWAERSENSAFACVVWNQ